MAIETVSASQKQQLLEHWEAADNAIARAAGISLLLSESSSISAPYAEAAEAASCLLVDAQAALKQLWSLLMEGASNG